MENETSYRRSHPPGARFRTWTAPDGWPVRRMDWPQPDGASPRGSLLFASGRRDCIEKYLEALAHWHERGWNVAAFDWRGQGASQDTGFAFESFDVLIDDLAALLDDWRAETPPPARAAPPTPPPPLAGPAFGGVGFGCRPPWRTAGRRPTRRCWWRR